MREEILSEQIEALKREFNIDKDKKGGIESYKKLMSLSDNWNERWASRVDFLATKQEVDLYASALAGAANKMRTYGIPQNQRELSTEERVLKWKGVVTEEEC